MAGPWGWLCEHPGYCDAAPTREGSRSFSFPSHVARDRPQDGLELVGHGSEQATHEAHGRVDALIGPAERRQLVARPPANDAGCRGRASNLARRRLTCLQSLFRRRKLHRDGRLPASDERRHTHFNTEKNLYALNLAEPPDSSALPRARLNPSARTGSSQDPIRRARHFINAQPKFPRRHVLLISGSPAIRMTLEIG